MIFKVCLAILGHYALKGSYNLNWKLEASAQYCFRSIKASEWAARHRNNNKKTVLEISIYRFFWKYVLTRCFKLVAKFIFMKEANLR